jgi:IS30 family transposase
MSHFTLEERQTLAELLQQGKSHRKIGKSLNRSHTSIGDELRRNTLPGKSYDPVIAHQMALKRQNNHSKSSKLDLSPGLKEYVIDKLRNQDWSPQQIAGKLKELSLGKTIISHETIYQFIYSEEGRRLKLWLNLRRKHKPLRQPYGARKKRINIPDRTPIHFRDGSVEDRLEVGHWEADLMIFSNQPFVLAVCVERSTRFVVITLLENKKAEEMERALHRLIEEVSQVKVLSITFDNGSENVCHTIIKHDYPGIETFFCDPYCSWQKGSVENTNALIRQYFPRSFDLSSITQYEVDLVAKRLNTRPRKCLHYKSPHQAFPS